MNRKPVRSSNLKSVGYDKSQQTLEVEFRTGSIYQYEGVHPNTARFLLQAPSKGKFFWKNVRNKFPYEKV
jgi:hypothetical protein